MKLKCVTINFIGYDKNKVEYNLTKTVGIKTSGSTILDTQIYNAIEESIKGTSIVSWEIKRGFMGHPIWEDICNVPVMDTCDY